MIKNCYFTGNTYVGLLKIIDDRGDNDVFLLQKTPTEFTTKSQLLYTANHKEEVSSLRKKWRK